MVRMFVRNKDFSDIFRLAAYFSQCVFERGHFIANPQSGTFFFAISGLSLDSPVSDKMTSFPSLIKKFCKLERYLTASHCSLGRSSTKGKGLCHKSAVIVF